MYGMDHIAEDSENASYRCAYEEKNVYINRWRQSTKDLKRSYSMQRLGLLSEIRRFRSKTKTSVSKITDRFNSSRLL